MSARLWCLVLKHGNGARRSWSFNGTSISMEELTSKTKLKKDDVITANASTDYGYQADNMVIVIAK